MPTAVHRADSTRSDRSDTSNRSVESRGSGGKKVSFSKAVRVKKFPRRNDSNGDISHVPPSNGEPSPEKRFWFKVYKNRHHQKPEIPDSGLEEVVTTSSHRDSRSSPTQFLRSRHDKKRPDSPVVRRNHVKRIVQKFNREAELRQQNGGGVRHRSASPPSRIDRSRTLEEVVRSETPLELQRLPKAPTSKKNPLVNGMKGIFAPLTKKRHEHHKSNGVDTIGNGSVAGSPRLQRSSILTKGVHEDETNRLHTTTQDVGIQVEAFHQVEDPEDDIDCLYSRVDKSKKTSTRRSTSPPLIYSSTPEIRSSHRYDTGSPRVTSFHRYASDVDGREKSVSSSPTLSRVASDTDYGSIRKVKTSSRSFGFSLGQKNKKKNADLQTDDSDVSSVASEPVVDSRPGSVLRGLDSRKKELSYENVSRLSDGPSHSDSATSTSGLWVREADQDYRKGMAQNDITVPSGGYVFTYTATLGKSDKKKKPKSRESSPVPEMLERRPKKEPESPVKILVNGEDVTDRSVAWKPPSSAMSSKKNTGRSVCSDATPVRGGLAAAYQARQRAAANGKSTSSSKPISPTSKSNGGPGSITSSCVSEPAFCRDTVVLYIPGVSHHSRSSSSLAEQPQVRPTVSRSQSVYQKNKVHNSPGNKQPKLPVMPAKARSETDLRRSKSIPRNTKFPWLRVKTTATPVH
uniref:Putative cell wall protein awa1 n=1 Tax=Ornithodoros turicata TaxID=34597 RepID=A0A2R5LDU4_9ACAR